MSDTWSESPFTFRYIVNIMRDEGLAAGRRPWAWTALPGVACKYIDDCTTCERWLRRVHPWLTSERRPDRREVEVGPVAE